MKQKAMIVGGYALLIFIGGIIGYLVAQSLASVIASSIIAVILLTCSTLILKGNKTASDIATLLTACLLAFFTYRYFLSYKIAPGGIMAFISGLLLIYLIIQRKK